MDVKIIPPSLPPFFLSLWSSLSLSLFYPFHSLSLLSPPFLFALFCCVANSIRWHSHHQNVVVSHRRRDTFESCLHTTSTHCFLLWQFAVTRSQTKLVWSVCSIPHCQQFLFLHSENSLDNAHLVQMVPVSLLLFNPNVQMKPSVIKWLIQRKSVEGKWTTNTL